MRRALVLVLGSVLLGGACGGGEEDAAAPSAASATASAGEPTVTRTRVNVADEPGAEPIATGEILEGSTLAGSPFCAGGSVVDTHGISDPSLFLIVETITCPDGTLSMALTGELPEGPTQTGTWMIVGGTGAYTGLHGTR
ncbi:MAG TPA: hypothetical protein VF028_08080 [Actinomycetota bacterium]|jgi:hypothetical protein|nr:hypothetical protein [Actinomycetota bacterium]